jgi:predicted nucleic acid-binding protein
MPSFGNIYLDTNIFIIAFENAHEISALVGELFAVTNGKQRFTTSELTLSELLVRPYREENGDAISAYEALIKTNEWLDVLPVDRPVLRQAAILRSRFTALRLPDALHVSTALSANCTHMLTADSGLKNTYEIYLSQSGLSTKTEPLTILRPDEATLRSLIKSLAE